MSTVEDAVIAAAERIVLACHQVRHPRRLWVRPYLKAREEYYGSDLLSVLIISTIRIIVSNRYVKNANSYFQCVIGRLPTLYNIRVHFWTFIFMTTEMLPMSILILGRPIRRRKALRMILACFSYSRNCTNFFLAFIAYRPTSYVIHMLPSYFSST